MNGRLVGILLFVLIVVSGGLVYFAFEGGSVIRPSVESAKPAEKAKAPREARPSAASRVERISGTNTQDRTRKMLRKLRRRLAEGPALSPEAQKVYDSVQEALDGNDQAEILKAVAKVTAKDDPQVRAKAVEALGWAGEKALPELMRYLTDPDRSIAAAAMTAITQSLNAADEEYKLSCIEEILKIESVCDADTVVTLSGELEAASDTTAAAAVIDRLLASKANATAEKALRDSYRQITGSDYTTAEAAKEWIDAQVKAAEDEKAAEAAKAAKAAEAAEEEEPAEKDETEESAKTAEPAAAP